MQAGHDACLLQSLLKAIVKQAIRFGGFGGQALFHGLLALPKCVFLLLSQFGVQLASFFRDVRLPFPTANLGLLFLLCSRLSWSI